jgi:DNA repair protein RadC
MDTNKLREVVVSFKKTNKTYSSIRRASDVAAVVRKCLITNAKENFIALYLDGAHAVIAYSVVSVGLQNATQVHPREVFQAAILCGARALVVAHNHPSGCLEPSNADKEVTKNLKSAGDLLGIKLLDHVIVTETSEYSFMESGLI